MKQRKKIIFSAFLASIVVCASMTVASVFSPDQPASPKEVLTADLGVDISRLPIDYLHGSFSIDVSDKDANVGVADYVFVARVISDDKTIYKDVVTMEAQAGGTKQVGDPYTQYTVEVIDNIKGKLKKNQPIQILKYGGITMDKQSVVVFEDDEMPQENHYYIFLGLGQPDGSLLVMGPYSNQLLDVASKQEIVSSSDYTAYKKAVQNEIKYTRNRFPSIYEDQ